MANFMKRGKKWQARITWRDENGRLHQKNKSGFDTKQQAKQYAIKLEKERLDGINIENDPTFVDYFDDWFKTYKKAHITPVTARHYTWTQKRIEEYFKNKKLKKITRRNYQQFINWYGKDHAPQSVKKLNSQCRACVRSAVNDGIITKNFTEDINLVWNEDKKVKVKYLSIEETQKLIKTLLDGRDPRYTARYMILTAIYSGARLGEIMALSWSDINEIWKTISITKASNYHVDGSDKKTKNDSSVRTIRVNQELINLINELRVNKADKVFRNQEGTVPGSNGVNKVLRHAMKKAGISDKGHFHFHSLRHVHVAYLLSQDVDIYSISQRLGHKDISTTTKDYAYLINEKKAKSEKHVESILDNLNSDADVQMMYKMNQK
ncbi:site-specific integrase [Limosilactobacillus walteri]|uniref:Site-specific integrase n=1 Tax=Limosilactobacillus walteri TaxID=2268022 RepID=A0ABR8P7Z1_9LACO|nr:site-specific integrase [Limosilactobacillus walteri]MBD5806840.1 site-specific integrase [Limosilactobacillus walteri]